MRELIVLKQFKNIVPERLATFINEHKIKTAAEAAVLADEYVLTHKVKIDCSQYSNSHVRDERRPLPFNGSPKRRAEFTRGFVERSKANLENRCNYCLETGHWKRNCPVLKNKTLSNSASQDVLLLCISTLVHLGIWG